jgi:hypothetical protein
MSHITFIKKIILSTIKLNLLEMKSYLIALTLLFAINANINAQISNGNVNYEMRVEQWRQTCDNDAFSADDNEVRIGLNSDGNTGGTATWTSGGSGASCGGNNYVRRWQADAPSTTVHSVLMYNCTNRTNNADFFNIQKESWEEDGAPDCSSSGDACTANDATNYTFKSVTKTACSWWGFAGAAGVEDGWSIGNSILYMKSVWRYTNGNSCASALNFGTLTTGTAKSHINTNRGAPGGASSDKGYTNVLGNGSPDVFYQFTISSPQVVTIGTNNAGTNYDSYLRLYNSGCGTEIAFDDDGGGLGTTSAITRALCAGTYVIVVEGFNTNTGDFNLSVVANNLAAINGGTIAGITNPTSICVGDDPGAFTSTADATGALTVGAYAYRSSTYQWERAPTNTFATITNVGINSTTFDPDATLAVGTYFFRRKITDACGTVAYSNIIQVNVVADPSISSVTSPPNPVCQGSNFTVSVSASGGTPSLTYQWQYNSGTWNNVVDGTPAGITYAGATSNSMTASTTNVTTPADTYLYRCLVSASGTDCNTATSGNATAIVVLDPIMPTATKSPNNANVCAGQTLTVSGATDAGGGTGTCNLMYRFDNGSGFSAWSTTLPSFAAVVGTNTIELRKECSGSGCNNSPTNVFSWTVTPQIVAPTLNTPSLVSGTAICQGQNVSATITAGSGGTGASDVYDFSTNGGSSWAAYTSGTAITTASATTSVQIRVSRTAGTGTGCNIAGPNVIATWPVTIQPIAPTLNVATPTSGTTICQGQDVSATITAGTGGTGASDVYEFSTNGGSSWSAYTSGATITTASATTSVQIRVSRTAGTGTGCNATSTNIIATWPVTIQPIAPTLNIATPSVGTICQGQNVSATINAGSGGTGASDVYEFSTNGGSSWSAYSPSDPISTASATTSVQVRVSRTAGSATGCNATSPAVVATWPVTIQPTLPTINTATPASGTEICQGDNVNVTINAGTGGTGASDVYEFSTNGGSSWASYTSGANITTTAAATSVQVRVSRTAGTGIGCNATATNVIATWPIRSGSAHVVLASNSTNGSTLPVECENGGWTYYADPTDPDKWLFAIEWGTTNATPKNAAVVTIVKLASNIFDEKSRTFYVTRTDAFYVMSRFWNVSTSTLVDPVNIRFYYDPAEITSITSQRDAKLTALNTANPGTHFPVAFQWFKTVGAPFSAGLINDGNNFNFNFITLTGTTGTENGVTYVEFNGITSFSGGSGGVGISPHTSTPLPVTYTSIQAKPINNEYIQVSWTTASEINNKGFEVTRSTDGINFEKIGFVNGHNNSSISRAYAYDDHNVVAGREYYYRLNQIDNDGKSEKSSIVSAYINRNSSTSVGEFYPNPTLQNTTIEVSVTKNTSGTIRLIDALGQEVMKVNNDLTIGLNKMTLNTSSLSAGMYIAYIQIGNEFTQKTIVVNK